MKKLELFVREPVFWDRPGDVLRSLMVLDLVPRENDHLPSFYRIECHRNGSHLCVLSIARKDGEQKVPSI